MIFESWRLRISAGKAERSNHTDREDHADLDEAISLSTFERRLGFTHFAMIAGDVVPAWALH